MIKKLLLIVFILSPFICFSQKEKKHTLPDISIKLLSGKVVSTKQIKNDGPIIISFWATWCKPCIRELIAMNEAYEDWKEETNVKIVAISVDDNRTKNKVNTFVNGRNWDFDVYLDTNSDLKRALNINNIPFTIILNEKSEIVYQHISYKPGDEEEYYEIIQKIAKGEALNK